MNQKNVSRGASKLLLAIIGLAMTSSDATAQNVTLMGIARDFRADHPDFAIKPADGPGHYAGNASLALDGRYHPEFTGSGFNVSTQWRNMNADGIAPHMYVENMGIVVLRTAPTIEAGNTVLDTYNPGAGPYDPSNAGLPPTFVTSSDVPVIPVGGPRPPYIGDVYLKDNKSTVLLDRDYNVGHFIIQNSQQVRVEGDVTLWVNDWFYMENLGTAIEVPDGSSLTIYVATKFRMTNNTALGSTEDPRRVTIYNMSNNPIEILNSALLSAHVVSPNAEMQIANFGEFAGTLEGEGLTIKGSAEFHNDGLTSADSCGDGIADSEGFAGVASPGDIESQLTFSHWFRDIDGVNASKRHPITLKSDGNGFYEFVSGNFLPLADELYGYDNGNTNSYFTFQVNAEFTYNSCTDQHIEIQGSDDIWVYVDGKLLIDLGGMGANQAQVGDLGRLGLTDGERYTMRVFYAHRSGSTPRFRIRTNVDLGASLFAAQSPVYAGWD